MTGDRHKLGPATGTATNAVASAVIAAPAAADRRWLLKQISASYSGGVGVAALTVTSDGVTLYQLDVPLGGATFEEFGGQDDTVGLPGTTGKDITVTLAAGGSGVVGKVNALAVIES